MLGIGGQERSKVQKCKKVYFHINHELLFVNCRCNILSEIFRTGMQRAFRKCMIWYSFIENFLNYFVSSVVGKMTNFAMTENCLKLFEQQNCRFGEFEGITSLSFNALKLSKSTVLLFKAIFCHCKNWSFSLRHYLRNSLESSQ